MKVLGIVGLMVMAGAPAWALQSGVQGARPTAENVRAETSKPSLRISKDVRAARYTRAVADAKPVKALAKKPAGTKVPSAAQLAARTRMKTCAGEWREAKAAGSTAGQTWPKFFSACNARLKT